ncbi:MAG: PilN domain-containing protein [Alphaproteobacteria bacterium]|nr:PilN domain-containing protein [Alphaproteobacteria bacterium]
MEEADGLKARIRRFLAWWAGELLALLPRAWARALGLGRDRLRVVVSATQAAFAIEGAGAERELGVVALGGEAAGDRALRTTDDVLREIDPASCEAVVLLAADRALRRELAIPRVPEADLRRTVAQEVERYTPFRAEQVYLFFALDPQKSDERTMAVAIAIAPRRFVDPVVDALVAAGAERRAVRIGIIGIDALLDAEGNPAALASSESLAVPRPLRWALAAVCVLALTAIAAPAVRLAVARAPLAERAAQTQAKAEEVRRLLDQVEKLSQGLDTIVRAKAEAPSVVRVLDRITALLPDDTYLDQFNVVGREIEIEGTTRASAALVRLLESTPMFEKVSYVAPVTRDPVSGAERFHFSIQFAGRKAAP